VYFVSQSWLVKRKCQENLPQRQSLKSWSGWYLPRGRVLVTGIWDPPTDIGFGIHRWNRLTSHHCNENDKKRICQTLMDNTIAAPFSNHKLQRSWSFPCLALKKSVNKTTTLRFCDELPRNECKDRILRCIIRLQIGQTRTIDPFRTVVEFACLCARRSTVD